MSLEIKESRKDKITARSTTTLLTVCSPLRRPGFECCLWFGLCGYDSEYPDMVARYETNWPTITAFCSHGNAKQTNRDQLEIILESLHP